MYFPNSNSPRQAKKTAQQQMLPPQGKPVKAAQNMAFAQPLSVEQGRQAYTQSQQAMLNPSAADQQRRQMAAQQGNPMQAAQQQAMAQMQQPSIGHSLNVMANIYGQPQGNPMQAAQQQALRQVQQSGAFRSQGPNNFGFQQQMPQQMPSMQQSAAASRAQMPQQMPPQQATRVRIPRKNPMPF